MKQLSLWTKLYLLILVVIIPLLILQIVGIVQRYEQTIDSEYHNNQELAKACRATIVQYFQHIWNTELAVGLTITRDDGMSVEEIEEYLKDIAEQHPTIKRMSWISPDGKSIASSYPNFRNVDVSDRAYFQQIQQGNDQVISDLLISRANQNIILPVVRGIRKDGELLGSVFSVVELDQLASILPVDRQYQSGSIGVFDHLGQVVFWTTSTDINLLGKSLSDQCPLLKALKGEVVRERYTCFLEKTEQMGVAIPIPTIGWGVFVNVTLEEVLSEIWSDMRRDIFFLSLTIVASLVLALLIGQQFLQPLNVLQNSAQSIFMGDLSARTQLKGNDELARTGKIFDQMAERIQELEESRSQFLQTAAHELRNPMAGIKGMLSLVQRRIAAGKKIYDDRMSQILDLMENEIDRLSKLLNQILEAFRVQQEDGLLDLKLEKINVKELAEKVIQPFQLLDVYRCAFTYLKTDQPLWVMGNYSRLEEVLRNLLSNAGKYSPNGGEVQIEVMQHEDYALITVSDEGIGIPEEQLGRIFECFYRVEYPYENDPGGMGLGLHICNKIIKTHGGEIWVVSKVGVGSKFYIKLPLK